MNKSIPIISVLMSAYNAETYVKDAVESILVQTFCDFEFIIINDGSTDRTKEIINSFDDIRIRLINNVQNQGLIYSLNLGLGLALGQFILRMDADDIAVPTRLEKQLQFFVENPDVGILGGAYKVIGGDTEVHHPKYNEEIKLKLLKNNSFSHPTIMMRTDFVRKYTLQYNKDYPSAEDYDFFVEASLKGVKMANLDDIVLNYRIHEAQITQAKADEQKETADRIRKKYFKGIFGNVLSASDLNCLKSYEAMTSLDINDSFPILIKLFRENKKNKFFEQKGFTSYLYGIMERNLKNTKDKIGKDVSCVFFRNMPFRFRVLLLEYLFRK